MYIFKAEKIEPVEKKWSTLLREYRITIRAEHPYVVMRKLEDAVAKSEPVVCYDESSYKAIAVVPTNWMHENVHNSQLVYVDANEAYATMERRKSVFPIIAESILQYMPRVVIVTVDLNQINIREEASKWKDREEVFFSGSNKTVKGELIDHKEIKGSILEVLVKGEAKPLLQDTDPGQILNQNIVAENIDVIGINKKVLREVLADMNSLISRSIKGVTQENIDMRRIVDNIEGKISKL